MRSIPCNLAQPIPSTVSLSVLQCIHAAKISKKFKFTGTDTHALLEGSTLAESHAVCLAQHRNDVDPGAQAAHELDVHLTQAVAGRCDEVEKGVHTIVAETGVTFDTRFLGQDVIVLALEEADDFLETAKHESWREQKLHSKSRMFGHYS